MMDKRDDTKSTLRRYYTLAHAMTPRKNSPTHGKSAESGDETDRSIDNEITESFFMDEINPNTESCSLDSSRENLLDGDSTKEHKSGSRPNSRPNSARRAPHKGSELPTDQRIKILEEGLKEADIEREVVLSCLGKEYLERIAMQNYLQEICSKSGLNYEETVSSIFTQTGAKHILENIMERRAKDFFKSKSNRTDELAAPQPLNPPSRDNLRTDENAGGSLIGKEKVKGIERSEEWQLKEFLTHFTGAENTKVNSAMKRCQDNVENSHTQYTKDLHELKEGTLEDPASTKDISGDRSKRDMKEDNEHIVSSNQSPKDNSEYPWEPNKIFSSGIHTRSVSQNNGLNVEKPVFRTKQSHDDMTFQGNCKQAKLIMPGKTGHNVMQSSDTSILRSLDLKGLDAPEKSIDSIDEGIFMLKSFLQGLQNGRGNLNPCVDGTIDGNRRAKNPYDSFIGSSRPRRKLSLDESGSEKVQSDSKPQRRRSYAEGMSTNKRITSNSQTMANSRLFKPTVASRNKVKEKMSRREFDSDTESGKQSKERRASPVKRSNSDVRHGPKRHVYSSCTSAEDDSSIDGEDRDYSDGSNAFHYVYQVQPEINEREYTKLMSILNMLHEQKMRWDSESRELNEKLSLERKLRSDLNHDNGVLRKSLEAANRAIKEINSNVQELKLTIVPLREENSKLRDQNQSLKTKLNLIRKDKAMLVQELQELKNAKLRYEEKLLILGELYKNDRIKLVTDSNNNHDTASNIELPKGGLSELFLTDGVLSENGNTPASKRLGRNRDFSKRHSFHGFEKIEELAGDAEELLAEKEKLEQENQNLKKELNEIREKIETNVSNETEKDDDILNRRRGWRMQREESKQRIIRDILKTESSQVYGRPYASCTNLTLPNEKGDNGSKTVNNVEVESENIDEPDTGSEAQNDSHGDVSLERDTKADKKEGKWNSWKKESERIRKRLQNCKFEKPIVKEEVIGKEEAIISQAYTRSEKDKKHCNADSDDALGHKVVESVIGAVPSKKEENLEYSESGNKHWRSQNNGSNNLSQNVSSSQSKIEINGPNEEKESKPKDIESFASPQWPTVREKIKAIYEQPVEILEQSLYERGTVGKYKDSTKEEKSKRGYRATSDAQDTRHPGSSSIPNGSNFQYEQVDLTNLRTRDLAHHERAFKAQNAVMETRFGVSREGLRMSRDNWQRKSTSEEITSYEDYRRKLRREELEIVYLKSNTTKGATQTFEQNGILQNGRHSYNIKEREHDRREVGRSSNHSVEPSNGEEVDHGNCDEKYIELSDGMQLGQRNESPWVQVPVYLRNMNSPKYHQISTPIRSSQEHFEGDKVAQEKTTCKAKGEKELEDVIRYAGSAFVNTGVSNEESELGKDSRSRNHDFVRQSSGTILYLDEIADSDSGSSSEASIKISRRRSKSFRKPRPKSEVISSNSYSFDGENSGEFRRNRSLRLPKKNKDDFFSVDIFFDGESQDDSAIQMHSQFFNSSRNSMEQQQGTCQHHLMHQTANHQRGTSNKHRAFSESGTNAMRSSPRRPKSPGRFSCEMCRELSKKKIAQERYCWEKYFPIGETTIETRVIKEDYV